MLSQCMDCPLNKHNFKRYKRTKDTDVVLALPYFLREHLELLNTIYQRANALCKKPFVAVPLLGCLLDTLKGIDNNELKKSYKMCKNRFLDDVKNAKAIICFGEDVFKLFSEKYTISETLLQPINRNNTYIIPIYSPIYLINNKKFINTLDKAIALTNNLLDGNTLKLPEIIEILDEETFKKAYIDLKGKTVGVDIETTHNGIFKKDFKIISLAMALPDKIYYIDLRYSLRSINYAVKLLSVIGKPVFHNYLFDGVALKKELGITFDDYEDTMFLAYLINENRQKSLKFLASIYLNIVYDITAKDFIKSGQEMADMEEETLKKYNSLDAYVTLTLLDKLKSELSKGLLNFYEVFMKKFAKVLFEMIYNGFPVDVLEVLKLKEHFKQKEKEIIEKLNSDKRYKKARRIITALETNLITKEEFLKDPSIVERIKLPDFETKIELTKPPHILALLYSINKVPNEKTQSNRVSLSEASLRKIKDELIDLILEAREARKLYSTYLDKYADEYVAPDGRVHASYSLTGTVTGRTSSSNPNLQNIPRNSIIKNIFYAPEGYLILQYDWAQIELRIAAALSNEDRMIEVYKQGVDLHKVTASKLFDKPVEEVTDEERQLAKACSFGVLYGISPKGLAERFDISIEKAKKLIKGFFQQYPNLAMWQKKIKNKALATGIVTTPLGRVRRLYGIYSTIPQEKEEALRQAVNSPVQATASDINLMLLYLFLEQNVDYAELVCSVHDSGVFLVKEDRYLDLAKLLLKLVKEKINPLPFLNGVPLKIEISVGKRWGELEEVEIADEAGD